MRGPSVVCWGGTRVGMARQGYDLQLTRYDEKLARDLLRDRDATGWERTPWHAVQRAAWEALKKAEAS